jgi:hypothetical protein
MKKLIVIALLLLLVGCATAPKGFGVVGQYNEGQFASDRNDNFIKLYTPEPEDFNPKLETITYWVESINDTWEKKCEWHPTSRY